ncbi:MAG TPA: hypothetical protein VFB26_07720 [Gaiellaceae bacterium]|nr:hypothetical protein [Gaiellaceae bacterium]
MTAMLGCCIVRTTVALDDDVAALIESERASCRRMPRPDTRCVPRSGIIPA